MGFTPRVGSIPTSGTKSRTISLIRTGLVLDAQTGSKSALTHLSHIPFLARLRLLEATQLPLTGLGSRLLLDGVRRQLRRRLDVHLTIDDRVSSIHRFGLCPVICMAVDRGTPARSRLRTAVRRKSWTNVPGYPAASHAWSQATSKLPVSLWTSIVERLRTCWNTMNCGKDIGLRRPRDGLLSCFNSCLHDLQKRGYN